MILLIAGFGHRWCINVNTLDRSVSMEAPVGDIHNSLEESQVHEDSQLVCCKPLQYSPAFAGKLDGSYFRPQPVDKYMVKII